MFGSVRVPALRSSGVRDMTRQPRFEIVRTHAGWHARFRASNGRILMSSEVYTRRRAAVSAVELVARTLMVDGRVEVRDVTERGKP